MATAVASGVRLREEAWDPGPLTVVWLLAAAKLALHIVFNRGYGYFRDELYYLACAEHLDWGYVDQPPLVAVAAWLSRALLGDSLSAIRVLPALAGAAMVFLTGLMAREFGGGRFAQALACIAVIVAPVFLVTNNFLSMNAFEPVFWMGCVYLLIRILKSGDGHLWLWFGVLAGLGLQNKHSTLFFGAAVVIGLLLTSDRRWLRNRWLWLGGALAVLIFLPNLAWQVQHGFPTYELLNNVKNSTKNVMLSPPDYFLQQILLLSPPTAIVWLAGLWYFLFHREGRRFRALGWTYLALLAIFIVLKGKHYYLAPIYPMLFAGGARLWENQTLRIGWGWLRPALVALLLFFGSVSAPIALPILPVDTLLRYQDVLAAAGLVPKRTETSHTAALPQHFADQLGWEEMVREVARIYHSLPPKEREKAAIFGNNYGQAGAIDFFGPRYGLPKAISGHQNYFLWGPRHYSGEIVIVLGSTGEGLDRDFEEVQEVGRLDHPYAMPGENRPIFLCRRIKRPIAEAWRGAKRWL